MAWQKGPMPKETYGWGGVVPVAGVEKLIAGAFLFADFQGDHVLLPLGDKKLLPHEIAYYDNSLELAPKQE